MFDIKRHADPSRVPIFLTASLHVLLVHYDGAPAHKNTQFWWLERLQPVKTEVLALSGRSWITPGALIFVENAQNVTISPPNTFTNNAGCAFGDYARPIALGRNAVDVELNY